ncbi:methyltransferase [uncultured Legionella sp.]|uniref:methyltransferase n=1 Tax=uncultured Legionella sp. TaxID=210934 RepID=UPI002626BF71|nr:methyltransferase [uncultured Legionella sp.]
MNKEQPPPHLQLAIMSREYVVSRAIHAVAQLGIADHMSEQPISITNLARLTSTIPELLNRVLNFLSDYGLFSKSEEGYALTPLSEPLRQDHPFSMKEVFGMFDESWWQAFAYLPTQLKTGTPAFMQQHEIDFFGFHNENPDTKNRFEKGMSKLSSFDDKAITKSFNFGQYPSLVDIGYGRKDLAVTIAKDYPELDIQPFIFAPELINLIDNNVFKTLPSADACILKGILHDFNDELAQKILIQCHTKMKLNSSLLIAEQVIPENNLPHTNKTMDIVMMVLLGGSQRTLKHWCKLVESAGFSFNNATPVQGLFTIMEFKK